MPENDRQYARRVVLTVLIDGHDATDWMAPTLLDFTYTCNSGGKADEVQLSLHDRDGHWSSDWKPKKGMPVEAEIVCADWEEPGVSIQLPCGSFKIDEVSYSGPPDKVQIKAVSADLTGDMRDTQKTRAWENTSLETVSEQIAGEYGLENFYSGDAHEFERQDQRNESDLAFLNRLSGQFGMSCKVHDGKLVMFDKEMAEGQEATLSIPKKGGQYSPKSWSFKESSSSTGYDKAEVAYTDPKTGTTHKATVKRKKKTGEADAAGTGGDRSGTYQERADRAKKTMTLQNRAENPAQAAKQGRAALHDANSKEQTASIEILAMISWFFPCRVKLNISRVYVMHTNAHEKYSHICLPLHCFLWRGPCGNIIYNPFERKPCQGVFLQFCKSIFFYNRIPSRYVHRTLSGAHKKTSHVRFVDNIVLVYCLALHRLLVQKTMLGIRDGSHGPGNLCQSHSFYTRFSPYDRFVRNLLPRLIKKFFHKNPSSPEAA